MMMDTRENSLTIRNGRVLTIAGAGQRRGASLAALGAIDRADVYVQEGRVHSLHDPGRGPESAVTIEANGRVVMPAFIDAHTHACWSGNRLDEWDRKRSGMRYLDILRGGGGIMSTVRAVRKTSQERLTNSLIRRILQMRREGTLAMEAKSGYGLTTESELKMLSAIRGASRSLHTPVTLTACIGHAIDPDVDRREFISRTIHETLDAVHDFDPRCAIDAYCDDGAWTFEECRRLFSRALDLRHPVRIHTDQFHCFGLTEWAIEHATDSVSGPGVISVDHLEATEQDVLQRVAESSLYAVLLPCTGFHTDGRYANGRLLADAGAAVVLATNCNPGSAPTSSMPFAIALGVRACGLTPGEAIVASTANAAELLGLTDRGTIEPGKKADLLILRHQDERLLAYEFGGNPIDVVIREGDIIFDQSDFK